MFVALDTNILLYAEGVNGTERQKRAVELLDRIPLEFQVVPAQVLGELHNVLTRKGGKSRAESETRVSDWFDSRIVPATSANVIKSALEISVRHQFAIWDAIILASAESAGCQFLLSEDMHDGFRWNATVIANPFASELNPVFSAALALFDTF